MLEGIPEEYSLSSEDLAGAERTLHVGRNQPIRLSTGHRILHHDGKCSRPHGHNYEVTVSVTGTLSADGWVVDKGVITSVLSEWDHRFLVERGDPLVDAFEASGDGDAVVVLDQPPTAEVMGLVLERRLRIELPETVSDVTVEVSETGELAAGGIL
ncbi:6-pyruvoyl tetrahydropterin synthase family protein [Halobacteria archaeon AArc-curdl1]|uniref:6-pyruvoyl tetrahydropterin synthase family protein n=1 Tax=Natronosalvus hydrolyticus TaxID=2979988 RepID=A0AAP2Z9K8_9EURY|nr:6-pyruvoyl tetrahydropterin synthase family protein [Halobacteria archaeon AArc-curdl1]